MFDRRGAEVGQLTMGTPHHNVTAVIMAGGRNSRFGALGQTLPKCLLPLPTVQTLLTRLIGQLQAAGIGKIAVCCSSVNAAVIKTFLDTYRATTNLAEKDLMAVSCPDSRLGPIPALAQLLSEVSTEWNLLCLADIFFAQPPFEGVFRHLNKYESVAGCLLAGMDRRSANGSGTGIMICEGTRVHAISYQPFTTAQLAGRDRRTWSGSFLFRQELVPAPVGNLAECESPPLEHWIQGLLDKGVECEWADAGPFVNVNCVQDYQFLIDSMREKAE